MNDAKEFLGKTLDAAIAEACAYYDVPREKLEIDIIEDAKTGIFGIVGARKAKIHARLATLPDFMQLGFSAPKPDLVAHPLKHAQAIRLSQVKNGSAVLKQLVFLPQRLALFGFFHCIKNTVGIILHKTLNACKRYTR